MLPELAGHPIATRTVRVAPRGRAALSHALAFGTLVRSYPKYCWYYLTTGYASRDGMFRSSFASRRMAPNRWSEVLDLHQTTHDMSKGA